MGCFNTLTYRCPACGQAAEFQSKMGYCMMKRFTLQDAPLMTLADFYDDAAHGKLFCSECEAQLDVTISNFSVSVVDHSTERSVARSFDSRCKDDEA